MGIQQLLPFLSKCTENVNISQFEGWTVAVDAYCWLHKGSYACSEELLLGTPTDKYVQYCLKFIQMLQRHKIKPVLVFDGQKLQAKSQTEQLRGEKRRSAAATARRLLLDGNRNEAKRYLGQAISVTPKMAHDVIDACRAIDVDCIVAQYEADAQLAYLSLAGIVHLVISEDSDLLVFGCRRVLFKLDLSGNGELIEQDRLGEIFGGDFSFEKFRYMCILSGCDYLDGVDGIGLSKALRVFRRAKQSDIKRILANLSGYLGKAVTLRPGFTDGFVNANNTFLYQLVFDPVERCVRPLTPRPKDSKAEDFPYAGRELEHKLAFNLAVGNLDPITLKPFEGSAFWTPKNNDSSIWSPTYELSKTPPRKKRTGVAVTTTTVTSTGTARTALANWGSSCSYSQTTTTTTAVTRTSEDLSRKRKATSPQKHSQTTSVVQVASKAELLAVYGSSKCARLDKDSKSSAIVIEESDPEDGVVECTLSKTEAIASPVSPEIISRTGRLIQRNNIFSAAISSQVSQDNCRTNASAKQVTTATDFFGVLTPPSTQNQGSSSYFAGKPHRSSLPPRLDAATDAEDSRPSSLSHVPSALAGRLASKRAQYLNGNSSSMSQTATSVPVVILDDQIILEDSSPEETENNSCHSSSNSGDAPCSDEAPSQCDNASVPAVEKPPVPVVKGGAVRLLLEKFAFKSAVAK